MNVIITRAVIAHNGTKLSKGVALESFLFFTRLFGKQMSEAGLRLGFEIIKSRSVLLSIAAHTVKQPLDSTGCLDYDNQTPYILNLILLHTLYNLIYKIG